MRSLSATEKLMPSPWLPSRRVVSYISTSGFIVSRQHGEENFYDKSGEVANRMFRSSVGGVASASSPASSGSVPPREASLHWPRDAARTRSRDGLRYRGKHPIERCLRLMCTKRVTSACPSGFLEEGFS